MALTVQKMEYYLPKSLYSLGYTLLFNTMVKYAGTTGLKVLSMNAKECTVYLQNRRKVQNHIGTLHACSMAVAAESASGIIMGMNVRDTHIPLLKSMKIDYVKRCMGNIHVKAWIDEKDYERIQNEDRGDVRVNVHVVDDYNNLNSTPIETEMIWAWTPKKRSTVGGDDKNVTS
jgi:Domain of unknown function (DUF4442)